ncbi:hypothetical protein JL720_17011 [Aureococcus anophagefferens]|nr:hypothetical protein JL720_17011 [Aureococcus anophagefferens]
MHVIIRATVLSCAFTFATAAGGVKLNKKAYPVEAVVAIFKDFHPTASEADLAGIALANKGLEASDTSPEAAGGVKLNKKAYPVEAVVAIFKDFHPTASEADLAGIALANKGLEASDTSPGRRGRQAEQEGLPGRGRGRDLQDFHPTASEADLAGIALALKGLEASDTSPEAVPSDDAEDADVDGLPGVGTGPPSLGSVRGLDDVAQDGDDEKNCAWVGKKKAKRCTGKVKSEGGVLASVACPGWKKSKTCAWVGKSPAKRCDKESKSKVLASDACPVACDACPTWAEVTEDLTEVTEALTEALTEVTETCDAAEAKNAALEAELEEAVADKAEAEVEKAALKAELEEAVADKTEAQGNVTTLEAENAALEAENAELKAAKASGRAARRPRRPRRPGVADARAVDDADGLARADRRADVGRRRVDSARRRHRRRGGVRLLGQVGIAERGRRALAVRASGNDGAGSDAGHARVFAWDPVDETWKQRGDDIDGEAADDYSGYSVSLSADGTALAVGASGNDGAGSRAGHARVRVGLRRRGVGSARRDIDGEAADDWSGYSTAPAPTRATRVFAWDPVDETWKQRGGDIGGEAADDWSGWSVSLSADGTMLAVGAWGNDPDNFLPDAGHARVFAWDSGTWVKRGDDIDGEAAYDWSGYSVSLSADGAALAVGRRKRGAGSYAGHARVFAWDPVDETWVQRGDDIDGEAAYDESGISVSLSADGTTLAVGAHYNDGAGSDAGHARVFAWDSVDETWVQRGDDVDGEAADDFSGYSVSLSADGTTLAVGAPYNDGGGTDAGHARVYSSWGVVEWIQRGDDIDGEAAYDYSGRSVSLSADGATLAVGASGNDGAGSDAGHARVFAWDPVDETADGTALAVGASGNDGAGSRAGHARVFAWDSDDETWVQRGDDIDGGAADDWSGYSVSLSADGTTLAVGAVYNDGAGSNAGHARVFAWDPVDETWKQRGGDIDGEAADDWSGWSVSLSADGTMLAVGAWGTTRQLPPDAGHARVFAWDSGTWVKRGDDIDGEAADDWSGYSVSLSADGTALAVGASGNDGAGSYAGHARVFAWDPSTRRGSSAAATSRRGAYDESGISVSLSGRHDAGRRGALQQRRRL